MAEIMMKPKAEITEEDVVERFLVHQPGRRHGNWYGGGGFEGTAQNAVDAPYMTRSEAEEIAAREEDKSRDLGTEIVPCKVAAMFIVEVDGEPTESADVVG